MKSVHEFVLGDIRQQLRNIRNQAIHRHSPVVGIVDAHTYIPTDRAVWDAVAVQIMHQTLDEHMAT